jgi:hypothetical protein
MAELPPWLDIKPNESVNSMLAGYKLGLEEREGNQRMALAKQKLGAYERKSSLDAQVKREQILSNFQREQTQAAVADAYHKSMTGLAKQRLDFEYQNKQREFQAKAAEISDTVGYANAVANGTPPMQARAQFPLAKVPGTEDKPATSPTETVTERFPAVEGKPADVTPAYTRGWYNPARWVEGKNAPAVTNAPAIEGHPAYSVSQKIPANVSPAQAFRAVGPGTNAVPGTGASAPKIIRDKNGKFILANQAAEDEAVEP